MTTAGSFFESIGGGLRRQTDEWINFIQFVWPSNHLPPLVSGSDHLHDGASHRQHPSGIGIGISFIDHYHPPTPSHRLDVAVIVSLVPTANPAISSTMKLSSISLLASAALCGRVHAFSTINGNARTTSRITSELNMRQPIMAGNWKVRGGNKTERRTSLSIFICSS
jgi:hypothetical protein